MFFCTEMTFHCCHRCEKFTVKYAAISRGATVRRVDLHLIHIYFRDMMCNYLRGVVVKLGELCSNWYLHKYILVGTKLAKKIPL